MPRSWKFVYSSGCPSSENRQKASTPAVCEPTFIELPKNSSAVLLPVVQTGHDYAPGDFSPSSFLNISYGGFSIQTSVRPRVDAFFGFVHGLESSGGASSERLKKAVRYAINQETYLRRFLSDGNIPCDNGYAKRIIRSYSIGRLAGPTGYLPIQSLELKSMP